MTFSISHAHITPHFFTGRLCLGRVPPLLHADRQGEGQWHSIGTMCSIKGWIDCKGRPASKHTQWKRGKTNSLDEKLIICPGSLSLDSFVYCLDPMLVRLFFAAHCSAMGSSLDRWDTDCVRYDAMRASIMLLLIRGGVREKSGRSHL